MKEKTERNKKIIADKKTLSWRAMEKKYGISRQAMQGIIWRDAKKRPVENSST